MCAHDWNIKLIFSKVLSQLHFCWAIKSHIYVFVHIPSYICTRTCMCASCFSRVWLIVRLWTVAHQAPLSMGFSSQEYWSGLPYTPRGDLPDPEIKPMSLMSLALEGRFFTTSTTWKAHICTYKHTKTYMLTNKQVCTQIHICMQTYNTHKHTHIGKEKLAYTSSAHIHLYIDVNTKTHACTCVSYTHTRQYVPTSTTLSTWKLDFFGLI